MDGLAKNGGIPNAGGKQLTLEENIALFQQLQGQNRVAEALTHLTAAVDQKPDLIPPEDLLTVAQELVNIRRLEEAERFCRYAVRARPDWPDATTRLADVCLFRGDLHEAISIYDQLFAKRPELLEYTAVVHVNQTIATRRGRIYEVLDSLEYDLDRSPYEFSPGTGTSAFRESISLAKDGRLGEALALLNALDQQERDAAAVLFVRGRIVSAWAEAANDPQKWDEAFKIFEELSRAASDSAEAFYRFGQLHLRAKDDKEGALSQYMKGLQLDPNHEALLHAIGSVHQDLEGAVGPHMLSHMRKYLEVKNERQFAHPIGKHGVRFIDWHTTYAFGHLATLPELCTKLVRLGLIPDYKMVIFAEPHRIANPALLSYWEEFFEIVTDRNEIRKLQPVARDLSMYGCWFDIKGYGFGHSQYSRTIAQKEWCERGLPPLLKTSAEHYEKGWSALNSLGVSRDGWFVTMHVREPGFKQEGDSPFYRPRFAKIETYLDSIKEIVDRGGTVIRIGEPTMTPLPQMEGVIDYAHSDLKSDWMDVFLLSQCRFFLCSPTGAMAVPQIFGRPILYTNWTPHIPLPEEFHDVFIMKRLKSTRDGSYMTYRELYDSKAFLCSHPYHIYDAGYDFVDNTSEDIKEAVVEMLDRMEKKAVYTPDEERLQRDFAALLPERAGVWNSRVGRGFMERYKDELLG